jgi:PII-like signaling protein
MIPAEASLLRLILNASDRWHGKSLYRAIVETARSLHMAVASVFLVDRSYGAHRRLRDVKSEYLFVDIPVIVEIVDAPGRIDALLAEVGPMLQGGLVTVEPVRVIRYTHHQGKAGPDTA